MTQTGIRPGPPIRSGNRRKRPNIDFQWLSGLKDKDFWAEIDRFLAEGNEYYGRSKKKSNSPGQR